MSSLSNTSTKMYALILLSLLPSASAQVSAFFENAPPCHKDCTPLWNVNYDCMQLGRVDLECMCSSKWMEQLYAGGTCSCQGSAGVQFKEWLDGVDRCAEYQSRFDATAVKTTSEPTSTSSSERSSRTSAPKTTGTTSDDDSTPTDSSGLITATMSGFESASETGGKSLATAEAASGGGSWESKKKWAIPVIAVAAIGGALAFALLAFCIWRRRRNERKLGNYAGVMGGSKGNGRSPPWWTLGGVVGGRKKSNKARESAMSEAGHGLVSDDYRPSFEPPRTRVLQMDQYGNYMPRTQGPAYITAGSYPHGRPLSPVEELRSAAATPSIASIHGGNVSPPPPEGYQPGPSVFRDIPEGAVVSPSTPDNTGARVPPAAPSTGLGFTGAGTARDITPPSRQLSNASSTYSGYSDSGVSDARSSPFPLLASQKRKPVRRNFNPESSPPSTVSSVRSAYNPVSPVSPIATSEPSDNQNGFRQYTSPPPPPLSPLRHPRVKASPQYYEDYNS